MKHDRLGSAPFLSAPGTAGDQLPPSPRRPPASVGRGRAPLPGAETGDSCPMAPSSLEIISSLALFYFFLTEEKAQKQLAGDSRASFSFPCPEGKKKAATSPRPGHVPGAGPLFHPRLLLGATCLAQAGSAYVGSTQCLSSGPGRRFHRALLRVRK